MLESNGAKWMHLVYRCYTQVACHECDRLLRVLIFECSQMSRLSRIPHSKLDVNAYTSRVVPSSFVSGVISSGVFAMLARLRLSAIGAAGVGVRRVIVRVLW
jgi:hypothetical protein